MKKLLKKSRFWPGALWKIIYNNSRGPWKKFK